MSLEQGTLRHGLRTLFIASFVAATLSCAASGSPIKLAFRPPNTRLLGLPIGAFSPAWKSMGVVIGPNTVLTCFHNIAYPPKSDQHLKQVKVLLSQPQNDIVIIQMCTGKLPISYLSDQNVTPGAKVKMFGRFGTYYGTVYDYPDRKDSLALRFRGAQPRMGDSGSPIYDKKGIVALYRGHDRNYHLATRWRTLSAFGLATKYESQPSERIEPVPDPLPDLPGTEDEPTQAPSQAQTTLEEDVQTVKDQQKEEVVPEPIEQGTVPQGTSLPPSTDNGGFLKTIGGFFASKAVKDYLIPAALGAAGIASTGGTGVAVYYGGRALLGILRRRKKKKDPFADLDITDTNIGPEPDTQRTLKEEVEEVLGRTTAASGFPGTRIPGRTVDEVGELLELAELEGFDPLMGAAYGLFMQDEVTKIMQDTSISEDGQALIRQLVAKVTDRINSAAPLVKG